MKTFFSCHSAFLQARWVFINFLPFSLVFFVVVQLGGCSSSVNRYSLIEKSLQAHDPKGADMIIQQSEKEYGDKSRVLYGMDRGMLLQLAGDYQPSNTLLEQAEEELDRLYTRKIRTETLAFLTNDTALPYEGDPYEQVLINVLKALNYAGLGQWQDALVEGRRIDHRLNLLSDQAPEKSAYQDDGFARYLTGILYERDGDVNNAFIAYRKAYETYAGTHAWSRTPVPSQLRADLLRTAEALHFTQELIQYQQLFPETRWQSSQEVDRLAQVLVISYVGRSPYKENAVSVLPISPNVLQLMLRDSRLTSSKKSPIQARQILTEILKNRAVRIVLPRLVLSQPSAIPEPISLIPETGKQVLLKQGLVHNVTAMAEKALSERMVDITIKTLARVATKAILAEGVTAAAQNAAGKDNGPLVSLVVGLLTQAFANASEDADRRSWRTLPDQVYLTRAWIPPGRYQLQQQRGVMGAKSLQVDGLWPLSLGPGETMVLIQRVMP